MSKYVALKGKLAGLKDLRHAIAEIKKSGLHKANEPEAVNELVQSHPIKHLGVGNNKNGEFRHILGREGDSKQYHVVADMRKMAEKKPCYSVSVLDKDEEVSRSPNYFSNIKDVVSAIVAFEKSKKWE
jgi:hypothetical protein